MTDVTRHPLRAYLRHVSDLHHLLDRKWGLPVLAVLAGGPRRFSDLNDALRDHRPDIGWRPKPGHYISHKVLRDALHALTDDGLITREPDGDTDRGEHYVLTSSGAEFMQVVDHGVEYVADHPQELDAAKDRRRVKHAKPTLRHERRRQADR